MHKNIKKLLFQNSNVRDLSKSHTKIHLGFSQGTLLRLLSICMQNESFKFGLQLRGSETLEKPLAKDMNIPFRRYVTIIG